MELNHLKYFYAVEKEGGFINASKALRIAQPAITKQVKNLELEVGASLFERVGRNVRLTKAGGDLYRHCEVIFSEVDRIQTAVTQKKEPIAGPLNVAACDAIASFLAPNAFAALVAAHPKIVPALMSGPASDLIDHVVNRKVELALLLHSPPLPTEVEAKKEFLVAHSLVIAKKYFSSSNVRESFIGSREINDSASKDFPTLNRLKKDYPKASIRISTNSFAAHKHLVAIGFGVSIMPKFVAEPELTQGIFRSLYPKETFEWPIRAIARKDHVLSKNACIFLEQLTLSLCDPVRFTGSI